jgi:transposase
MYKLGKTVAEINEITGIKIRTIYNHIKTLKERGEGKLLSNPPKNTRKPPAKLVKLKEYIQENPFTFNKEVAIALKTNKTNIQRWRKKLGLTRKKAKTTYKESDEELKKSSYKN